MTALAPPSIVTDAILSDGDFHTWDTAEHPDAPTRALWFITPEGDVFEPPMCIAPSPWDRWEMCPNPADPDDNERLCREHAARGARAS